MKLNRNKNYFNEASMQVRAYYASHTDMFSHLPNDIQLLFLKYVNEFSLHKLSEIYSELTEYNYEFLGVTDSWLSDFNKVEYRISALVVDELQLLRYMPQKSLNILKAVKALIEDVKYFAYLLNTNHMQEYIENTFPDMATILAKAPNTSALKFCKRFHIAGLGIPKMLRKDYMLLADTVALENSCKDFYNLIGESYLKYKDTQIKVIDKINVAVTRDASLSKNDEVAYFAQSMLDIKSRMELMGIPNVETLYSKLEIKVLSVYAEHGYRRATKKEVSNKIAELIETMYHPLDEETTEKLIVFCYFSTGESKYLASIAKKETIEKAYNLEDIPYLKELGEFLGSSECETALYKLLRLPPVEYLETADDEIEDIELNNLCESLIQRLEEKKTKDKVLFMTDRRTYDIAKKALKPTTILTEKQRAYLYKAYRTENYYDRDIDSKVAECLRKGNFRRGSKVAGILEYVKENESCSYKQKVIIEEAFKIIYLREHPEEELPPEPIKLKKRAAKKPKVQKVDTEEKVQGVLSDTVTEVKSKHKESTKPVIEADDMELSYSTEDLPEDKKPPSVYTQVQDFNMAVMLFNGGTTSKTKKKRRGKAKKEDTVDGTSAKENGEASPKEG